MNKNGTLPRANAQVNNLNGKVVYDKYSAKVVKTDMPNRQTALDWERENSMKLWNEGNSMNIHRRPRPWEDIDK